MKLTNKNMKALLAALAMANKALREAEDRDQKKAVRDWCLNSHAAQNAIMMINDIDRLERN
jgi:hypothetical protein